MDSGSFRTGDTALAIVDKYVNMVYRIAFSKMKNKTDAEDIFQNVFMRLIRSRPQFTDETHVKAWLIRTTVNCAKNLLTSAWFRKSAALDDALSAPEEKTYEVYGYVLTPHIFMRIPQHESSVIHRYSCYTQRENDVKDMDLPEKYRTVIHLHYDEGLPLKEMALILRKKENTVKSLLRKKLEGEYLDV